ncbi:hypothetical protein bcgnr5390_12350 [Bacillus luti]|nr:hypothetical protein BC2903_51030 [Bacillus cereus]
MTVHGDGNVGLRKKYRLGYDYILLARKAFAYKGDLVSSMSINVLFRVFDDKGDERFFEAEDLVEQELPLKNGECCYLTDMLTCSFDRESILKFKPNLSLLKDNGYTLQWEIDSYWKDLGEIFVSPEAVEEDEFMEIIKTHIDAFDNSDNRSAQSCAYFTHEYDPVK